jgi:hypothetical protein
MLKTAGYDDPKASAESEKLTLREFTSKVFKDLYQAVGRPKMTYDETLSDEAKTKGAYTTNSLNERNYFFKGEIVVGITPFSSYLKLASTIGHELIHAKNFINSNMTKWYKKGGEDYMRTKNEYESYNWEDNVGGDSRCNTIFELSLKLSNFK